MDLSNNISGEKKGKANSNQQFILDRITEQTELFRIRVNKFMDQELTKMVDQCKAELKPLESSKIIQSIQKNNNGRLKEKEFVLRNSLLTDMYEVNHIRTIYHIFVAIFILLLLSAVMCDFDGIRSTNIFNLIKWNFGKLDVVVVVWLAMQINSLPLIYNGFTFWATNRQNHGKIWDYFWLSSYITYLIAFFYYPAHIILVNKLPPASACIIIGEQIRGIMKSHAFIRTNAEKVIEHAKTRNQIYKPPPFSSYLYHNIAPTILYRDEYPRTSHIRWQFVISHFCEVVACILFSCFVIEHFVITFEDFGREPISVQKYVSATLNSVLPGGLFLLFVFYSMLHSWSNAFAELLRFGDRQFYMDWWNSTSYSSYYRTWNIIIHDYLYSYVYKDIRQIFKSNIVATLAVFTISSIIHEYILTMALGFFIPVMLILFGGVGVVVVFVLPPGNKESQNIFFWLSYILGNGIMMSFYSMEWFARKNCPSYPDSSLDFIIPRIWVCYKTMPM